MVAAFMRVERAAVTRLAERLRASAVRVIRDPASRWHAATLLGVAIVFASALRVLFAPFFADTSTYGFRDWDSHSAYRYITVLALKRYHELPFWHPWFCGGFPAWAYSEGATNLVSPYLPIYLAFPVQIAERLEVILSTLCALVFTYLLAGRVTKSASLRALVAVAYGINGRWVMQASEGHTWHLQYSWLPLALFLFDVSLEPGKTRWALYAGAVLAMIAYMGGVYPLPHAALVLTLYAAILTLVLRTSRPFVSLAIAGSSAIGFAAPKLLPIVDLMTRYPRKIDSTEAIGLGQLLSVFTDSTGNVDHDPAIAMPSWGWMEYGIYVGAWITAAMVVSVLAPSGGGKGGAFRASGLVFLLLGCGAFHERAPWTLLHQLPGFSSQHVPSRFLLPAVLLLMLAFAAFAGERLDRRFARAPWLDLVLLLPVYFIAANIASVGLESTKEVFMFKGPAAVEESKEFHHVQELSYRYTPDWQQFGRQELLAMYANTGVIRCYGIPFHEIATGAIAQGGAGYRGEAYLASGAGTARVTAWTPNTATVRYEGAEPGATLVYNMNYDASWRADGAPAIDYRSAVATHVSGGSGEVRFRYYPRTLNWGLFVFAVTAFLGFGAAGAWRDARMWRYSLRLRSLKPPNSPIG
jgi:hypothetical protein